MTTREVTLSQQIAIALRLEKTVLVGNETKGGTLGLGSYDCARCSEMQQRERGCQLAGKTLVSKRGNAIDFHNPSKLHLDLIYCCPLSVPGIWEVRGEVAQALRIKEVGYREWYGVSASELPYALVSFIESVESARARFEAERLDLWQELRRGN